MPKDLLSDAKIRTAKPDAKPYKLSDGGGVFFRVATGDDDGCTSIRQTARHSESDAAVASGDDGYAA
jgi:hypothetical protein